MKLTEKNKLYAIAGAFLLMLLIAYKVAVKDTFMLARSYRDLKEKSAMTDDLPKQITKYTRQLAFIDQKYFKDVNSGGSTHEYFLEKLSYIASECGVTITEYPPEHIFSNSLVRVETHNVMLKGRFRNLLRVLHRLEVQEHIGRITSVNFYIKTNRRTKITALYMQLILQNYNNQEVEE